MASTPSAISSPAPGRRCRRRARARSSGSMMSLVTPSVRSDRDGAARRGPRETCATATSRPCFCASVSVSPHQAISGSVKTTAGIASGSNATLARRQSPRPRRALRATPCAPASARRRRRRSRRSIGSAVRRRAVDLDEAALRRPSRACLSRPGTAEFGRRPTETSTRSNVRSRRASAGALAFEGDRDPVLGLLHRRRPWC